MGSGNAHGRIASLDVLRLFAALLVVAFHYLFRGAAADGYIETGYPEAAPYALYGYLGVNLFFLISGFVISWSAEGRDVTSFGIARFVRLWPGFVICMTVTFAFLSVVGHPAFPVDWRQYVANLTMFAPAFGEPFMDGAYWSIVLEIVFYGWVSLAILAGLFDTRRLELVAGWLLVAMANEFFIKSGALRMIFVTEYAGFFAGGILAFDMARRGVRAESLALFAGAFLFSTVSLFSGRAWMLDHYGVALSARALVASPALVYAVFLLALRLPVPASRTVAFIGALTYPLYLLHQHIGYVLIDLLAPVTGRWMAASLTVVAMLAAAGLL